MRLQTVFIFCLTLAGFALRLYYLTTTHPFFDEYTTVLGARQILAHGWPLLPSGLFYEHGLLATYLIAPFTALFINTPVEAWQPAHWGLMLARWPSAVLGTLTIPLIYGIGRRLDRQPSTSRASAALLAAGLFALSPEGMVWGGRARMYALATFLVLLTVYWAYRGAIYPAPARYRWWAVLALLATLLTQFGAMLLVPPLVVAMVVIGWLSHQAARLQGIGNFVRRAGRFVPELLALLAVLGIAVWFKRLGQPVGMVALDRVPGAGLPAALLETITYQIGLAFNWPDMLNFLADQFGPAHLFWLALTTVLCLLLALVRGWSIKARAQFTFLSASPSLFLWLVFGLILLEMIILLASFRQNPRYLVMFLPLFYLIAARTILNIEFFVLRPNRLALSPLTSTLLALSLLLIFTTLSLPDLRLALVTPEPAYETAFEFVRDHWQPGDALLTMNTPAAAIFGPGLNGFTVQADADQFLLNKNSAPIDRWLGAPWIGTALDFNAALNAHPRAWFVIDTIRQPVYFRGDWQAIVASQMEPVLNQDNALVYRTRPDRVPLPTQPEVQVKARLNDKIELIGYTLQIPAPQLETLQPNSAHFTLAAPLSYLKLTLFWQAQQELEVDYTVFLHLRRPDNSTVAQQDGLSVAGAYPSSRWQPGETIIDPFVLALPPDLPPGQYRLWAGMYRLDTLERLAIENDASGENAVFLGEIAYQ